MQRIDLADYLLIAEAILGITTDRFKRIAKLGLVESALAAPFAGFGDHLTWRRPPDDEAAEMVERLAGREIDEADSPPGSRAT